MKDKFEFDKMVIITSSEDAILAISCDADGSEGSGCDCDSPN